MLLSFVAGIERVQLFEVCVTISALIHYFTLVSLMWMAAEALLMFQKAIISVNLNYKYFIIVSLVCWRKLYELYLSLLVDYPLSLSLSLSLPSSATNPCCSYSYRTQ